MQIRADKFVETPRSANAIRKQACMEVVILVITTPARTLSARHEAL